LNSPPNPYKPPDAEGEAPPLDRVETRGRLLAFGVAGLITILVASPIFLQDIIGPRFALRVAIWATLLFWFLRGKPWARWAVIGVLFMGGAQGLTGIAASAVHVGMSLGMICLAVVVLLSKDLRLYLARVRMGHLPEVRRVPPEQWEEADFQLFQRLELTPEEFAARHGHKLATFNFHTHHYQRPGMNEWVQELAEVFLAPGLPERLRSLREKYLTPEEIRQAEEFERDPF
jgi:hypothetical protein